MKRKLSWLATAVMATLFLGAPSAPASMEVSASVNIHATADFYTPLAPAGVWVDVGSYGRCWHPSGVAVGWRPYCEGEWVWTDCGWYWESDEPWAWACYHYGWWVMDPVYGWIWVPGIEWAPAWVSWRVGDGYIGWAPLAPHGVSVSVSAPAFVFVKADHFEGHIRPSNVIINNTTVFAHTKVMNNMKQESRSFGGGKAQKVMVNEGPGAAVVQKATGKRLQARSIREVAGRTRLPSSLVSAHSHANQHEAKPSAVTRSEPAARQPQPAPSGRGEPWDGPPATGHGQANPLPGNGHPGAGPMPHGPEGGHGEGHAEHHGKE